MLAADYNVAIMIVSIGIIRNNKVSATKMSVSPGVFTGFYFLF
jgi:hypothetical protein